jgi:hypothetical protein
LVSMPYALQIDDNSKIRKNNSSRIILPFFEIISV